ncbi:hypothetical protein [Flagellimonas sp. S3867]|uniref:hypothetical protein n=1 Tax=Flagellimonas sp. S3867 TaxID=2768063 RepID=UPI001687990C|nr:hypothetical protein [Flagellimonas sp. S3867]
MKLSLFAFALLFSINSFSQESSNTTGMFIRVFDLQGNKIAKGKIQSLGNKELQLKTKKLALNLPVSNIGKIKTGRSGGTNVGVGALTGTAVGVVLGVAAGEDGGLYGATSTGDNVASMSVLGAIFGSVAGGLSTLFKKNKSFNIDGDIEKWKAFVNTMSP